MLSRKNTLPRKDFSRVLNKGETYRGESFVLRVLKNNKKNTRIGFVVGKKIAKKPSDKNYYKRVLRHVFKNAIKNKNTGYDIVVIAQQNIKEKNQKTLENDARKLIKNTKNIQ